MTKTIYRFTNTILFTLFALLIINPSLVFGQDKVSQPKTPEQIEAYKNQLKSNKQQQVQQKNQQAVEKIDEVRTKACEQTQSKFNLRINRYEENKDKHTQRYRNVLQKISDFADRAEARGCNLETFQDQFTQDQVKIEELIAEFHATQRMFVNSMQSTRALSCTGESKTEARIKFRESQQNSQQVRTKAKAIQEYITKTIRPQLVKAIQACAEQVDNGGTDE